VSAWEEITIGGPEGAARAFVAGVVAAKAVGGALFARDLDIETESLGERLKELFAAGSHHVVLAPASVADGVVAALEAAGGHLGLHLERRRPIESASFPFRLEVFSRELAETLRAALLVSLPTGVSIAERSEAEETHPEAHVTDLYAPLHRYIYRASGRIAGALPGVLEVRRRAGEHEVVSVGPLRLVGTAVTG
jgi:hypothetical protein